MYHKEIWSKTEITIKFPQEGVESYAFVQKVINLLKVQQIHLIS
jgi:hypothetical protein